MTTAIREETNKARALRKMPHRQLMLFLVAAIFALVIAVPTAYAYTYTSDGGSIRCANNGVDIRIMADGYGLVQAWDNNNDLVIFEKMRFYPGTSRIVGRSDRRGLDWNVRMYSPGTVNRAKTYAFCT